MNKVTLSLMLTTLAGLLSCAAPAIRTIDGSAVESSRARWNAQRLSDYEYEIENRCFCTINGVYRVTVKGDHVTDVFDLRRGLHVPREIFRGLAPFRTISELFGQLDTIYASAPEVIDVTFDPEYGFPSNVVVDGSAEASDDELVYYVRNLETRGIW